MSQVSPHIAILCSLVIAACVPPQQQGGAPAAPAAQSTAGGGSCEAACARAIACNQVADDGSCPDACHQLALDAQTLGQIEHGSCEQVAQIIRDHTRQSQSPQRGTGGGGRVVCTAEGSYEVCDGEYCRTKPVETEGIGANQQQAAAEARQQCLSHLNQMALISQSNNRASVKQSCQVTGCR